MSNSPPPSAPVWFSAGTGCFLLAVNPPLVAAWLQDPSCKSAPIGFIIWLLPLAWELSRRRLFPGGSVWMSAALMLGLIGAIGELQVLKHAALALWISGFFPSWQARWVQWSAAISWIPAWGWASQRLLHIDPYWSRIALAVAGMAAVVATCRLVIAKRHPEERGG